MKREDNREERAFALLQALGDLNEEDVLRAEPGRGIRKRRNWGSVAAAAAFILVCGSVVGALYISWPMERRAERLHFRRAAYQHLRRHVGRNRRGRKCVRL